MHNIFNIIDQIKGSRVPLWIRYCNLCRMVHLKLHSQSLKTIFFQNILVKRISKLFRMFLIFFWKMAEEQQIWKLWNILADFSNPQLIHKLIRFGFCFLYPCIHLSLYPCIRVSLYPVFRISVYPCSLYPYIPVSLYPCIPLSLYPYIPVSLYPCISISL